MIGEMPVQHVQLAFDFHAVAINGVLDFFWRVDIEMAETATQIGRRSHLPEQPVQAFSPAGGLGGNQC